MDKIFVDMAEVSDIRVFRYGVWHSLRNQKVFDGSDWRTFSSGSGIFHNGEWYTLSQETIAVIVTVSLSVVEDKDGVKTWYLTIGTEPDILSSYVSEVNITGTITMSDTNVYSIDVTATGDEMSVDTGIPYVDGIVMGNVQLDATLTNDDYYVSEVTFTGMFNVL